MNLWNQDLIKSDMLRIDLRVLARHSSCKVVHKASDHLIIGTAVASTLSEPRVKLRDRSLFSSSDEGNDSIHLF